MKVRKEKFEEIILEIDRLISLLREKEEKLSHIISEAHPNYTKSIRNLIHYRKIRSEDIRKLQKELGNLGLSRLAKAEEHILFSLYNIKFILEKLIGKNGKQSRKSGLNIKTSQKLLVRNIEALLGPKVHTRRVRIMVTIPAEGAENPLLIEDMVRKGMSVARINCAHDSPDVWKKMIGNIRLAEEKIGRKVMVSMDLGGPKIRTGAIKPGPKVRHINPVRDNLGRVNIPETVRFIPANGRIEPDAIAIQDPEWFANVQVGDKLFIVDTREKQRELKVTDVGESEFFAETKMGIYVATDGIILNNSSGLSTKIGELPPKEERLSLAKGDHLFLHKENIPGENAFHDEKGKLIKEAHISCTLPEVIDQLVIGDKVKFDDGKISGIVYGLEPGLAKIRISLTKGSTCYLGADKGINFPGKELNLRGLTEKDKSDLKFVIDHADVVNMSFVNSPQDVEDLLNELDKHNARNKLGIILKIETRQAFNELTNILLKAYETFPIGVMIARGDLAIETGWNKIGRIQEEMLSLCSSGHIPVIWATQVLETLAKKGVPSRSEITDATSSIRADAVMLNKGPYIVNAIELLDTILKEEQQYQDKHRPMLPELKV